MEMSKLFTQHAWDDYMYWLSQDKKTIKRINTLIKDIERNGNMGIGKPEPLMGDFAGFWSRRINEKDRLIYRIQGQTIQILSCRYHYDDH